jgi:hypothetical protein
MRKIDKKLHPGRGSAFLKSKGKGIKGISFYNASERKARKETKTE